MRRSASVGGYQLEGVGIQLFERIEGDHFTILGLPLLPLLACFAAEQVRRWLNPQSHVMFVLGLTGSIGMGKSTTAKMFAEEGVPVQDADVVVHRLYEGEATAAIEAAFPGTTKDGKVDRVELGERVLGDADAIKRLEAIVHPLVAPGPRPAFWPRPSAVAAVVAVLDIPLLFETGGDDAGDAVVVVTAPADTQRARALERAGMTEQKLAAIMAKQMPDAEKRHRADFVVDTSQGIRAARAQVREILKQLLQCRSDAKFDCPTEIAMREIVLDTETTGLDPAQGHRLVEVGCIELLNRIPTGEVFHRLSQSRARHAGGSFCRSWPVG